MFATRLQKGRERKRWGQQETIAERSGRDPEKLLPFHLFRSKPAQKRTTRANSQALVIRPDALSILCAFKPNFLRAVKAQLGVPSRNLVSRRSFRVCKPACGFVKIREFRRYNFSAALAATIVVLNKFG
jgi:hypothetical protein